MRRGMQSHAQLLACKMLLAVLFNTTTAFSPGPAMLGCGYPPCAWLRCRSLNAEGVRGATEHCSLVLAGLHLKGATERVHCRVRMQEDTGDAGDPALYLFKLEVQHQLKSLENRTRHLERDVSDLMTEKQRLQEENSELRAALIALEGTVASMKLTQLKMRMGQNWELTEGSATLTPEDLTSTLQAHTLSAWEAAAREGNVSALSWLVEEKSMSVNASFYFSRDSYGGGQGFGLATAIEVAALYGQLDAVAWLAKEGADVNAVEHVRTGHQLRTPLMLAIVAGHEHIAKFLVTEAGADVNAVDKRGKTALTLAVEAGSEDLVKWLVQEGGAEVDAVPDQGTGSTALITAISEQQERIAKWLVTDGGASVNIVDVNDYTAFMMAALTSFDTPNIDLLLWLVDHGADLRGFDDGDIKALDETVGRAGWTEIMRIPRGPLSEDEGSTGGADTGIGPGPEGTSS